MNDIERDCALTLDEMSMTQSIEYDVVLSQVSSRTHGIRNDSACSSQNWAMGYSKGLKLVIAVKEKDMNLVFSIWHITLPINKALSCLLTHSNTIFAFNPLAHSHCLLHFLAQLFVHQ